MQDLAGSPWWIVSAAAAPPIASAAWVLWRWMVERGDKLHETVATREQILLRDLETQRVALSRDQADFSQRLKDELVRTQLRAAELEVDRDRGWHLARWWNQRSHGLRHDALNAQLMVEGLCAREGVEPPAWPEMSLPALEDPR